MFALEIEDINARYGKHAVLQGVSLRIQPGQWFCLLGPNGVGKSTLLHCISTRVAPTQGQIRLGGLDLLRAPLLAKQTLGFACAPEQLPGLLTGRQCLDVYAAAKSLASIDNATESLSEALGFTRYLDQYVDTYSLGTRQKLCVLLALMGDPQLIVLDEAFNGLDPKSSLLLKQELKLRLERNVAVLLATHSLDIVEHYANRAALMMSGRIVHEWDESQLSSMRAQGVDFEAMLASVSEAIA